MSRSSVYSYLEVKQWHLVCMNKWHIVQQRKRISNTFPPAPNLFIFHRGDFMFLDLCANVFVSAEHKSSTQFHWTNNRMPKQIHTSVYWFVLLNV